MTISSVYRTLWRHKLFIILLTVLLAGAAWFLTARQTKLYTASSLVRVQQRVTDASDVFGALQTGERLARTYAEIAKTREVREQVETRLGIVVPYTAIKASQVSNLELLRLRATHEDPVLAMRIANALPSALAALIRKTGTSRDIITPIEQTAAPPTVPSSPNLKLNIAIALLVGLILNSGLALMIEAFSDRVGSAEDIERATGQPVIATIPPLSFVSSLPDSQSGRGERWRPPGRRVVKRPARDDALPPPRTADDPFTRTVRPDARRSSNG